MEEKEYCLEQIGEIKSKRQALQAERAKALKFYNSDPSIVPFSNDRSKATTTDLFDVIEWVRPSILEIFTSGEDVIALQPETEEDIEPVKRMELLINKQLKQKNKWFQVIYDVFTDGMLMKEGVVKYQWFKDVSYIDREYRGLNENEFMAKMTEKNFEVTAVEEVIIQESIQGSIIQESIQENIVDKSGAIDESGAIVTPPVKQYNIRGRYIVEDEYPLIEAVPPEDIGYMPTARELDDTFVYHKVRMSKSKFIKKYGKAKFEKIEEASSSSLDLNDVFTQRFADLSITFYDKDKQEVIVYECFYRHPDTDEPWLTIICGDEVLVNQKNVYDRPPFEIFSPIRMSHRIMGLSFYDILKELQMQRTALIRQIFDNTYMANFRRYFGDPTRINMDDFLNNNTTNAFIRVIGDPSTVVMPENKAPLPPEVFNFFELLNVEKDYHSGVPRAFQGVLPNVLHETMRGQARQINQAAMRVQLLARLMAETFVAPLVKDIINLNLKFLQKSTMVRFLNEWVEITPDNITGKYDIEVKVGLGTGTKDLKVAELQQVLGIYAQIYKAGIGVVTAQNVYHTLKELLNAMGYKNTSDFVTDPEFVKNVQELSQLVLSFIQRAGINSPEIIALVEKVMSAVGMQPQTAQVVSGRHFPGQVTPAQPSTPMQPMQPRTAVSGGEFWA